MILPRLRNNLDFMPSPAHDRPGLLIRDTYQYSDSTLIIPPLLVHGLEFFDGARTDLDLHAELTRLTGDLEMGGATRHLIEALSKAGFLEDETYAEMKAARHRAFDESPVREPAHVGSAYPDELGPLQIVMQRYLEGAREAEPAAIAIAAPHVSPEGGWQSYSAAYRALSPDLRDRTFVVLGTSHYGQPDKFGLTRKPFRTPYGDTRVDGGLVDELANQPAALMEDYCHAIEHSIEFQVLFLQSIYGADVKVLPVLCGSFARSIYLGGEPEQDEGVRRFLGTLGEIAAREGDRLFWVLGVDMAHMGARYGDDFMAHANRDRMTAVAGRDERRIDRINAGDPRGFWDLVQENRDDLKWCGSSPIYTFLKAVPPARGTLRRYDQWNIDAQSVVSFAGISFAR
jgi:AmmeMemoRadiSam system protein B